MAKLVLADLANLSNPTSAVTTINANNAAIEAALENTLSRDGTSPNSMNSILDMNSYDIININLADDTTPTSPVRWDQFSDAIDYEAFQVLIEAAATSIEQLRYIVSTTTHTLLAENAGKMHVFTNDLGCTVTVPPGLSEEDYFPFLNRTGSGTIVMNAGLGVTLTNQFGHTAFSVGPCRGEVICEQTNVWFFSGATQ